MTMVHHSCRTAEHYTPEDLVVPIRDVVGPFDLDPASCALANEVVGAGTYYSLRERGEDGLALSWRVATVGRRPRVFVNSPNNRSGTVLKAFWRRAVEMSEACTVVWVGFSVEQLGSLQLTGRGPTAWPTLLLKKRVPYDTPGRPGVWKSLWAEARETTPDPAAQDALVAEWLRGPLVRVPGDQPPHRSYVTLLGASPELEAEFTGRTTAMGVVVRDVMAS